MKRILVVDDEENIRRLLMLTLEDLEDQNVEILQGKDGEEALELIKENHIDLVYLDVMMPKKDGYEVCEIIRKDKLKDKIYIVLLTAKGQEFDKKKGIEVGANLYLTKPFDPEFLLNKTCEILNIPNTY